MDHRSGDLPRIAGICDRVLLLNSWCKHVSIKCCGNMLQPRKRINVKSKDRFLKIHDLLFLSDCAAQGFNFVDRRIDDFTC